jgi:hypothetical protein
VIGYIQDLSFPVVDFWMIVITPAGFILLKGVQEGYSGTMK